MNCQEALELLYDIIDQEASEIDVKEVKSHLHRCRHCSEIYRVEESVQAFIQEKVNADSSLPRVDALRVKVLEEIDAVDAGGTGVNRGKPPFFRLSTTLAMAASLVLVIGAAFLASQLYRHQNVSFPLEQSHWKVAELMAEYQSAPTMTASMSLASSQLNFQLEQEEDGYQLAGGRVEHILGCDMAHLVYKNGEQYVSVFVAPAGQFEIPEDVLDNAVQVGELTVYDHFCRGCRLVYHQVGDAIIVTASTDRQLDLLQFQPGDGTI
jgi:anti-sigma factor (TIGR02949 family)